MKSRLVVPEASTLFAEAVEAGLPRSTAWAPGPGLIVGLRPVFELQAALISFLFASHFIV